MGATHAISGDRMVISGWNHEIYHEIGPKHMLFLTYEMLQRIFLQHVSFFDDFKRNFASKKFRFVSHEQLSEQLRTVELQLLPSKPHQSKG